MSTLLARLGRGTCLAVLVALAPGGAADEAVGSHVFEPTKHDDAALASEDDAGTHGDLR